MNGEQSERTKQRTGQRASGGTSGRASGLAGGQRSPWRPPAGISLGELSRKSGVDRCYLARIANRKQRPSLAVAVALATTLTKLTDERWTAITLVADIGIDVRWGPAVATLAAMAADDGIAA